MARSFLFHTSNFKNYPVRCVLSALTFTGGNRGPKLCWLNARAVIWMQICFNVSVLFPIAWWLLQAYLSFVVMGKSLPLFFGPWFPHVLRRENNPHVSPTLREILRVSWTVQTLLWGLWLLVTICRKRLTHELDLGHWRRLIPSPTLAMCTSLAFPVLEAAQRHSFEIVMWCWDHLDWICDWKPGKDLYISFSDSDGWVWRSICFSDAQDKPHM